MTYCHDLFYITVKYHDYIPNGFQVMERTRNCVWNHQGEITQKVWKWELSFLYATHHHDLFYITVKYHDYIPNGFQVMEGTRNCIWNHQGGNNSVSMKARVVIYVRNISSWPVLHNCEVSWLNSEGYSSYRADRNMYKKSIKGEITQKELKWGL